MGKGDSTQQVLQIASSSHLSVNTDDSNLFEPADDVSTQRPVSLEPHPFRQHLQQPWSVYHPASYHCYALVYHATVLCHLMWCPCNRRSVDYLYGGKPAVN